MNDDTRLDELLADHATQGLSDLDHAALTLLLESESGVDADHYEGAATALDLAINAAFYADDEPMPAALANTVRAQAEEFMRDGGVRTDHAPATNSSPTATPASTSALWSAAGWFLAAAAITVMALGLFDTPGASTSAPTVATVAEFIATHADAIELDWGPGGDATGANASGRVVWSQAAQQGFMVFDDLAVNNVSVEQYQLWIFDADREHPVDGGVFDIRGEPGEVVPIFATLNVAEPALFAVTVERPGGVVVSDKSRITLAADPNAPK